MIMSSPVAAFRRRSENRSGGWIPHKAVSSVVDRDKEVQVWREQRMPKQLPGFSGGKLPGRSKEEKGKRKRKRWRRARKKRNEVTRGIAVGVGVTGLHQKCRVRRKEEDEGKDAEQKVRQKWDCSQIEDSFEEGDVMD